VSSITLNADVTGSHQKIIYTVKSNWKVLDVGCNAGYLSKAFKEKGCFVVGIDQDERNIAGARGKCDCALLADLETLTSLPYEHDFFDALVFADVLEHLKEPRRVVEFLARYLKPGGYLIASIPNVARIDVRLNLLRGRFEYEPTGILAQDHVRFFTHSTAQRFIRECGFDIERMSYTGIADKIKILPGLFAFQFLIVARKKNAGQVRGQV
jgi:O-antigen biosynthesis protein